MNISRNVMQNFRKICIGTALVGGALTLTTLANSTNKTQSVKDATELTTETTHNPIETPMIPATATALAMLGVASTGEKKIREMEKNIQNDIANKIDNAKDLDELNKVFSEFKEKDNKNILDSGMLISKYNQKLNEIKSESLREIGIEVINCEAGDPEGRLPGKVSIFCNGQNFTKTYYPSDTNAIIDNLYGRYCEHNRSVDEIGFFKEIFDECDKALALPKA